MRIGRHLSIWIGSRQHQESALVPLCMPLAMRVRLSAIRLKSLIRRAPGTLCPSNLGEKHVHCPEVPGRLVAADAAAGTGRHDGPDQVVVHRLLPGCHR
jgi:hypothetical protein